MASRESGVPSESGQDADGGIGGIDRKALETLLARKKLKPADFGFDFDHLDSMPDKNFASHSAPKVDRGHTKLYREIQKAPVTFPDRIHELARGAATFSDWGKLLAMLATAIDQPFDDPEPAKPAELDLSKLPEPLRKPVALLAGAAFAAIDERDDRAAGAAILMRAIDAARADLAAFDGKTALDVTVETHRGAIVVKSGAAAATHTDPDALVWIDLGGDDRYEGSFAGADRAHPVRVVLDFAGNDTYVADRLAQGAGHLGIGVLCDFAGNDRYELKTEGGQGAATDGVGILHDAAGDDAYVGNSLVQGAAYKGIGLLVDREGRDTYEAVYMGQASSLLRAAGVLIDLDGNDEYLAHDPLHGHPVTHPAPQDEKHSTSMSQGAAMGDNRDMRAGGLALLVDAKGDDRYRAGCWAQGIGYFLAVGALVDLDGDDTYNAWVYTTGSGAHGGFGLLSDRRGDDTYRIGGWNCLGMAVDYGIGMALDGAGHDRYLNVGSGLGWNVGLGIALFQDGGGDDVYEPTSENNMGYGKWYEREDYNGDGRVTPAEKRQWGLLLDLGGLDRYKVKGKNGQAWDQSEFAGGLDVATPAPPWKVPENWQDLPAADVLKLGASADAKARASFALEHGLMREAFELLPPAEAEAVFGKEVLALRDRAKTATKDLESLAADCAALPEKRRVLARALVKDALAARLDAWAQTALKPLLDKRKTLDRIRGDVLAADATKRPDAVKRLQTAWAERAKNPVKTDAATRSIAAALDAIDPGWRDRLPLAAANVGLDAVTLESLALTAAERAALANAQELEKAKAPPILARLNDYRVMLGRGRLVSDDALAKTSADQATAQGKAPKPADAGQIVAKAKTPDDALSAWLGGADHAALVDAKWTSAGFGAGGGFVVATLK